MKYQKPQTELRISSTLIPVDKFAPSSGCRNVINQRIDNRIFPLFSFSLSIHSQPRFPLKKKAPIKLSQASYCIISSTVHHTKIPSRTKYSHLEPRAQPTNAYDACFNQNKTPSYYPLRTQPTPFCCVRPPALDIRTTGCIECGQKD